MVDSGAVENLPCSCVDAVCVLTAEALNRQGALRCPRNRDPVALGSSVEDPILTPLHAPHEHLELLAALRMERMRDPDHRGQLPGARSSTFIDRKLAGAARPKDDVRAAEAAEAWAWARIRAASPFGSSELSSFANSCGACGDEVRQGAHGQRRPQEASRGPHNARARRTTGRYRRRRGVPSQRRRGLYERANALRRRRLDNDVAANRQARLSEQTSALGVE